MYDTYYEKGLLLLRSGGLIALDNVSKAIHPSILYVIS